MEKPGEGTFTHPQRRQAIAELLALALIRQQQKLSQNKRNHWLITRSRASMQGVFFMETDMAQTTLSSRIEALQGVVG